VVEGVESLAASEELRAVDGRVPGRRGLATRQRLLAATRAQLSVDTYRDLRVVDIAREAGTSPATFYQYFSDVTEAVLALCEDLTAAGRARLSDLVETGSWEGQSGWVAAKAIAGGFVSFWEEHWPLMRVMELTSAEGDPRFRMLRTSLLNEFTRLLAQTLEARGSGRAEPMATASVLVSMLVHVSAHQSGFGEYGISAAELVEAMAAIVFTTVTGDAPPGRRRGAVG
jgi:AcrR family transcriptional regulator